MKLLRLAGSRLSGTLPQEISHLTQLVELQVGFNPGLTGPIPEGFSKLSSLERFYAWNSSLTEVSSDFGELPSLVSVDLTDNRLQGPLPASLSKLTTVTTAYFDGNTHLQCPLAPEIDAWLSRVMYHARPCQ